jgi:catechol 2,3-dioxygenase-like lactoylglutathione lyase family enzyme
VLTDDLDATRTFYCEVLGLEAGERPPLAFPGNWLYLDGVACVHIADRAAYEANAEEVGLKRTAGPIDHMAFAAGDHEALVARLEAAGVQACRTTCPPRASASSSSTIRTAFGSS